MIIGKRIKWKKILLLISTFLFLFVTLFEFVSLANSKKEDNFLIITCVLLLLISLLLLTFTILSFLKKNNAILIKDDNLIIRNYKEKIINFDDIIDIKYTLNYSNRVGFFKSGVITLYLSDNSKIKVSDILDVSTTCQNLRKAMKIV